MKILAIRLKNLASLEGEVEIDFEKEPLKSAGLYAISGPTGSGKSTILDALCLALYDATPRFRATSESVFLQDVKDRKINQSDVRNILRRGTSDGYAEVDFIGSNKSYYRSRWSVRRAYGKADGALQPQEITAKNLTTNTDIQGTKTEILNQLVTYIGLSYEQFTRTVLLAQNEFATFLKSKEEDKAELLEKLTGTEIYSQISQEIYKRSKEESNVINSLQGQFEQIKVLDKDELTNYEAQEVNLEKEISKRENTIKELNKQSELLKELTKALGERNEKKKYIIQEESRVKTNHKEIEQHDTLIKQFEEGKKLRLIEIEKAKILDVQIANKQGEVNKELERLKKLSKEKENIQAEERSNDQAIKALLADISRSFDVKEPSYEANIALLKQMNEELEEGEKINKKLLLKKEAIKIDELMTEQSSLLKQQVHYEDLQKQYENWISLSKQISDEEKELNGYKQQIENKEKSLLINKEKKANRELSFVKIKDLYEQQKMAISKDVKLLRKSLTKDAPCPVCGSKEHPYFNSEEVDVLFQKIEKQYKEEEIGLKELEKSINDLNAELAKCKMQEKNSLNLLANYNQKLKDIKLTEEQYSNDYFSNKLKEINKKLTLAKERISDYNTLDKKWSSNNGKIEQRRKALNDFRNKIEELKTKQANLSVLKDNLEKINKEFLNQEKELKEVTEKVKDLQNNRNSLLGGRKVTEEEKNIEEQSKKLIEKKELLRSGNDKMKQNLASLQGQLEQLTKQIEGLEEQKSNMKEVPNNLPQELDLQLRQQRQDNEKLITLKTLLKQDENSRKAKADFEKKLKKQAVVAEKWKKLDSLFGSADGKKFKVIAQGYTLNLLLRYANKHLSYLAKRYELKQVSEQLTLQVVDRYMLDEVRTVHSLSGGESFLVSLALALGLSSLSSRNLNVDSLFIDEGFGSLDAETLNMAMEALEQLQSQGRKIGVISHVQEMSERIPAQIKIQRGHSGRSTVSIIG